MERLLTAIEEAAEAGDPRAKSCLSENVESVLERLAKLFVDTPSAAGARAWVALSQTGREGEMQIRGEMLGRQAQALCREAEQLQRRVAQAHSQGPARWRSGSR